MARKGQDTVDLSDHTEDIIVNYVTGSIDIGTSETDTFTNITNVITGSGDDTIILSGSYNTKITVTGGDGEDTVQIADDLFTSGNDLEIICENIEVLSDVVISTRLIADIDAGDHLNDPSSGSSGNILLDGKEITINNGAQLLAHTTTFSITTGPDDWTTASRVYQYTSTGSGSGMVIDVISDGAGGFTVIPVTIGVGYADGDVVTFLDPNGSGTAIELTIVKNSAYAAGNVTVDAYDHAGFSGLLVVNITKPEAHVTVGDDVVIKGGNVSISSEADNTVLFDDDSTAVGLLEKVIDFLDSITLLVGVSIAEATADINIGNGVVIDAANLDMYAHAVSLSEVKLYSQVLGLFGQNPRQPRRSQLAVNPAVMRSI